MTESAKLLFAQPVSKTTAQILALKSNFILGHNHLFDYNALSQTLSLSPAFQTLLKHLVHVGKLDPKVLEAKNLSELNATCQKPQGKMGGLLRPPGVERWDLVDYPYAPSDKKLIHDCFYDLGFVEGFSLTKTIQVNHCIVFGTMASKLDLEARILETLSYLQSQLTVTGSIYLLGSYRSLTEVELEYLQSKIKTLSGNKRSYWSQIFSTPDSAKEANSCLFLWEYLSSLKNLSQQIPVITLKSTRIGVSYCDTQGYRATTETTAEDWIPFYQEGQTQSIFAVIEQPYLRLCDQLQDTILSKRKQATFKELIERIQATTFHFAIVPAQEPPLIRIVLDEIARHIYRTKIMLDYTQDLCSIL